MPRKRLTLALDPDLWDRLAEEAADRGLSIAAHVTALLEARDRRINP